MKNKRTIKTTAVLVALMILYSSVGMSLNTHYCSESHKSTCNFVGTDIHCTHCHDHDHVHEYDSDHCVALHFAKACCCHDVQQTFRLAPNAETEITKHIVPIETVVFVPQNTTIELSNELSVNKIHHQRHKIPPLFVGHERVLFLSSLKLDGMC